MKWLVAKDPKAALEKELARAVEEMWSRRDRSIHLELWGEGPGWVLREEFPGNNADERVTICQPAEGNKGTLGALYPRGV